MTRKGQDFYNLSSFYLNRFIFISIDLRQKRPALSLRGEINKWRACKVIQISCLFFFFSLPTNQMAVRFQTQGSGRQSRNKIAFLGRGIGLTRCQIKGLFTHACTRSRTQTHVLMIACVRFCVSGRVFGVSALAVRQRGHVQKSVSEHPLMEYRTAFKVTRTNSATQVDTGTHECLIGLLSGPGGDIHPPLLEFKYSF